MYTIYNISHKAIIPFFLVIFCISITSCSKQLDKLPTDQIDASSLFSSASTFEQGVLGAYANWQEEYFIQLASVQADECRIGTRNAGVNGSAQQLFRWSFSVGDVTVNQPWANAYLVIETVNKLLEGISNVPAKTATDQTKMSQLKGELLAIRAFMHFELYRAYAYDPSYTANAPAVPYVTGTDINSKPSRPKTADFFIKLKSDLANAETLLAGYNSVDNSRMGALAVLALEARVALYMKDWTTAATKATVVINTVPLADPTTFASIWSDQSNAEVIFKLKRNNRSTLRPGDIWKNASTGIVYFAPATKLLQQYDSTDVRLSSYFSTDTTLIATGQLPDVIQKYAGQAGAANIADIKVFRVSEMYLIRAEAYAQANRITDAASDINALRTARIAGYQHQTFSNQANLLSAIFTERYKELPFEGHRLFDLRRAIMNIVRGAADLPDGSIKSILRPTDAAYYTPIPQAELLVNSNILPNNPGW